MSIVSYIRDGFSGMAGGMLSNMGFGRRFCRKKISSFL